MSPSSLLGLGAARLRQRPWGSALAIGVVTLALCLPALLLVLLAALQQQLGDWRSPGELTLFLQPDTTAEQARAVADQLERSPLWTQVAVLAPDDALARFKQTPGINELTEGLTQNPFPYTVFGSPVQEGVELSAEVERLGSLPQVALAQFDLAWLNRLQALAGFGARLGAVLGVILLMAAMLAVGNTIRLEIGARHEEIALMQILGATPWFIQRPFIAQSVLYGLAGGVLAAAGCALALQWLAPYAQALLGPELELRLGLPWAVALVGLSILGCVASAWIVVRSRLQ